MTSTATQVIYTPTATAVSYTPPPTPVIYGLDASTFRCSVVRYQRMDRNRHLHTRRQSRNTGKLCGPENASQSPARWNTWLRESRSAAANSLRLTTEHSASDRPV